jgi:hypothetical protein
MSEARSRRRSGLSDATVRELRVKAVYQQVPTSQLADEYQLHPHTIRKIVLGRLRGDAGGPFDSRRRAGRRPGSVTLSPVQVMEIRSIYQARDRDLALNTVFTAIAERYMVSTDTVRNVCLCLKAYSREGKQPA